MKRTNILFLALISFFQINAQDGGTGTIDSVPIHHMLWFDNPASTLLNIESDLPIMEKDFNIEIYNLGGTLFDKIEMKEKITRVNIAQFPRGVYIVRVFDAEGIFMTTQKVIIH